MNCQQKIFQSQIHKSFQKLFLKCILNKYITSSESLFECCPFHSNGVYVKCHQIGGTLLKNILTVFISFPSSKTGLLQEGKKSLIILQISFEYNGYFYFPRFSIKKLHPEIFKARYFFTAGSFDLSP